MRADKYDPRYVDRYSRRNVYEDFGDWLRQHPIWIIGLFFAYIEYIVTTEEV